MFGALGGPRTAKRKIQIRQYITEQNKAMQSYADPFVHDENDGSQAWQVKPMSFSFKTDYIPDYGSKEEPVISDGILSRKVDLDEADRFLAGLRLPRGKKQKKVVQEQKKSSPVITPMDLADFKTQNEKLEKVLRAETIGESPEEEEDE